LQGRGIIRAMKPQLLRWTMLLAMALMLCGHLTELFDAWDQTMATGQDADYAVVLLAACAGLVVVLEKCLRAALAVTLVESSRVQRMIALLRTFTSSEIYLGLSPPLVPLRI